MLVLVSAALAGFAANSLLTRAALQGALVDPMTFMSVRLVSGALMLAAIIRFRSAGRAGRGSWIMATALATYAVAFTLAYTRIAAGAGALLLFASVHVTMFARGWVRGERPSAAGLAGTALAIVGLGVLTAPGLSAPDATGALLMVVAGASWGVYSLLGRSSADPMATTADNFMRAAVMTVPLVVMGMQVGRIPSPQWTTAGVVLASLSGAVASGLAYAAWYAALPRLPAWRAALVQLAVPVVTALAAAIVLNEAVTMRLLAALALVVGGLWLARR